MTADQMETAVAVALAESVGRGIWDSSDLAARNKFRRHARAAIDALDDLRNNNNGLAGKPS